MYYFFKAVFDSLVIFFSVFITIGHEQSTFGKEFGMVTAGMTTFIASVFMSNMWVLMKLNQHTLYSWGSLILMLIAPYFFFLIYSEVPFAGQRDKGIYKEF